MEQNSGFYEYRTLERASTFRVLALRSGVGEEPLRGELYHADIHLSRGLFVALSYVWGNVVYERHFVTPTGNILLTPSLEVALKRVRLPDQALHIWADAI